MIKTLCLIVRLSAVKQTAACNMQKNAREDTNPEFVRGGRLAVCFDSIVHRPLFILSFQAEGFHERTISEAASYEVSSMY